MSTIAVLDTTYADTAIEREAAASWSVAVDDRRVEGHVTAHDGVLVQYATIDGEFFERHPSVRVVGRYGVGVDTIDLDAASARGIAVYNVPDYCVREVATHATTLALASIRRIRGADALVRSGRWHDWATLRPIPDLSELTLGLLGVGHIGRETGRLLGPFVRRVIAHDPAGVSGEGLTAVSFDRLLAESDILSLHCPLLPATQHIINAETLSRMRPGAHLINVSRGGLVDAAALASALASGSLGGAALDVVDDEPPSPDSPLFSAPNLVITNHIAWLSESSEPRLRRLLAERCAAYLAGSPLTAPLNAAELVAPERTRP
ncbi:C-terminal binding protein [Agromyces silvae]|uniref:C-terminal binding protein n=1 Tax=Agromyces silvae TaxID=3388266 RepID=UPI00280B3074|nr:C-terminal binding protein [Agromyces protaetiae]